MTASKRTARPHARSERGDNSPRNLSILALEALARYSEGGLAHPRDEMHKNMAVRLAKTAQTNKW